jgi:hypothetical protein
MHVKKEVLCCKFLIFNNCNFVCFRVFLLYTSIESTPWSYSRCFSTPADLHWEYESYRSSFVLGFFFFFLFSNIMCFVINFGLSDKNGGHIYIKYFFIFLFFFIHFIRIVKLLYFYWLWQFTSSLSKGYDSGPLLSRRRTRIVTLG